eukprot:967237-Pelagomonas_calceolata.AAC.2
MGNGKISVGVLGRKLRERVLPFGRKGGKGGVRSSSLWNGAGNRGSGVDAAGKRMPVQDNLNGKPVLCTRKGKEREQDPLGQAWVKKVVHDCCP